MTRLLRMTAVGVALAFTLGGTIAVHARSSGRRHSHAPATGYTFRLRVAASAPAGFTYWVAYGPLQGRFGIIRLRHISASLYAANDSLPRGVRASFDFLASHGSQPSRLGPVPAGVTIPVAHLGPVMIGTAPFPVTYWAGPAG